MDRVLTDANLINHVFWCIDDQSLSVIRRSLLNWCMVNRTFCGACMADLPKAMDALLQRFFKKEFKRHGEDLKPLFAQADVSFNDRLWALLTLRRHDPPNPAKKPMMAFNRFLLDLAPQFHEEKSPNMAITLGQFPTFLEWARPKWRDLSPFKRTVYEVSFVYHDRAYCLEVQAMYQQRPANAVANAFMAQVAAEVLADEQQ